MKSVVVIGREIFAQTGASHVKIYRITPGNDLGTAWQLAGQLHKGEPTGIFWPAIIRLKGRQENRRHSSRHAPGAVKGPGGTRRVPTTTKVTILVGGKRLDAP